MTAFYFGTARDAPAWRDMSPTDTPVGVPCTWCSEAIVQGDDGVVDRGPGGPNATPWHGDCWIRQICGGVNHIEGTCTHRGGTDPCDPPDMTLREAATAAVKLFEQGRF